MSNISQKQRLIQNYTLLAVECFCIILSFALALLTRGVEQSYHPYSDTYITTVACILFFHLLSYYLFDWNTNIFRRGYYVELVAVCKYNLVLIFFLSFFLYVSKLAEDFSRLVFVYFFIYNILLTYVGHLLLKQYFTKVYRTSSGSNKMFSSPPQTRPPGSGKAERFPGMELRSQRHRPDGSGDSRSGRQNRGRVCSRRPRRSL